MSGHTTFTSWINSEAEYVLIKGKRETIKSTFFTADPDGMPNSDTFNIETTGGVYELNDKDLDYGDLGRRYEQH